MTNKIDILTKLVQTGEITIEEAQQQIINNKSNIKEQNKKEKTFDNIFTWDDTKKNNDVKIESSFSFLNEDDHECKSDFDDDLKVYSIDYIRDNCDLSEEKYINYFDKPILVNKSDYRILLKKSRSTYDYLVLTYLYKKNNKCEVIDKTFSDILNWIGKGCIRDISNSINRLEDFNIISVNRQTKPYEYEIIDYEANKKKGMFNIPEQFIDIAIDLNLKHLRGVFARFISSRHCPANRNRSKGLLANTLRRYYNAQSYKEVNKLEEELFKKGIFSSKIVEKRDKKRDNLFITTFNNVKFGIKKAVDTFSNLVNKSHFKKIATTLINMDIDLNVQNLTRVLDEVSDIPFHFIDMILRQSTAKHCRSKNNTINYYIKILNETLCQYKNA